MNWEKTNNLLYFKIVIYFITVLTIGCDNQFKKTFDNLTAENKKSRGYNYLMSLIQEYKNEGLNFDSTFLKEIYQKKIFTPPIKNNGKIFNSINIFIENGFKNTKLCFTISDSVIFDKFVTTDLSIGFANESLRIQRNNKNILKIYIDDKLKIVHDLFFEYPSLCFNYFDNDLYLIYSNDSVKIYD